MTRRIARLATLAAVLAAGIALAPAASAGGNVAWSVSIGGPGYAINVGQPGYWGGGYGYGGWGYGGYRPWVRPAPIAYAAPVYAPPLSYSYVVPAAVVYPYAAPGPVIAPVYAPRRVHVRGPVVRPPVVYYGPY